LYIVDVFVVCGVVSDCEEVFVGLLFLCGCYYVWYYVFDLVEVVWFVVVVGGVLVMVYLLVCCWGWVVSDEVIEVMVDVGLVGLEVYYCDNDEVGCVYLFELVCCFDLLVIGFSDYYGVGKLNCLGENIIDDEVLVEIECRGYGMLVVG